jgi:hypothetical protein
MVYNYNPSIQEIEAGLWVLGQFKLHSETFFSQRRKNIYIYKGSNTTAILPIRKLRCGGMYKNYSRLYN